MYSSRPTRSSRPLTAPGVADPEGLMRTKRCNHSLGFRSTEMTEVMKAHSNRENICSALADYVVSEEPSAVEERTMRAERTVNVSQTALRDAIASIPGSIKVSVCALVTQEGLNGT